MKILIYTTHRTGSTSLAQFLMTHYECDYHRGSLLIPPPKNIIIKLTPSEFQYNIIKDYFDKRIILIRENTMEQAESRVYADLVEKKFVPYTIDKKFLIDNKQKIIEMQNIIINENNYLKTCEESLLLTYDEIYNSSIGLIKLEEYLNSKFSFKINNYKKYRDNSKTII